MFIIKFFIFIIIDFTKIVFVFSTIRQLIVFLGIICILEDLTFVFFFFDLLDCSVEVNYQHYQCRPFKVGFSQFILLTVTLTNCFCSLERLALSNSLYASTLSRISMLHDLPFQYSFPNLMQSLVCSYNVPSQIFKTFHMLYILKLFNLKYI